MHGGKGREAANEKISVSPKGTGAGGRDPGPRP
jgi:hypothetical protein